MQNSYIIFLLAAFLALFALEVQATPTPGNAIPCDRCSPVPGSPPELTCDITTSCITVKPNGQYHCACRAGYKSTYGNNESYHSYRMPFAGEDYRVFVRPGVVCDTLCEQYWLGPDSCQEVNSRPECA